MRTVSMIAMAVAVLAVSTATAVALSSMTHGIQGSLETALERVGGPHFALLQLPDEGGDPIVDRQMAMTLDELGTVQAVSAVRNLPSTPTVRELGGGGVVTPGIVFVGSDEKLLEVFGISPAEGRYFSRRDIEASRDVCVLGADLAVKLGLGIGDRLGKTRDLLDEFEVIGILPQFVDVKVLHNNINNIALIPINRIPRVSQPEGFSWDSYIRQACGGYLVRPVARMVDQAMNQTRLTIGNVTSGAYHGMTYGAEPVNIAHSRVLESYLTSFLWVRLMGLVISAVCVGGVSTVLAMESLRSIGIKRALGAPISSIVVERLAGSAAIWALGSGFGALFGLGVASAVASRFEVVPQVGLRAVLEPLGVSLLFAVAASLLPAHLAAKVDPASVLSGGGPGQTLRRGELRLVRIISALGVATATITAVWVQGLGAATLKASANLMEQFGAGCVVVRALDPFEAAGMGVGRNPIAAADYKLIGQSYPCFAVTTRTLEVIGPGAARSVRNVVGLTKDAYSVKSPRLLLGRVPQAPGECLLGSRAAEILCGDADKALGASLALADDVPLVVSGVLADQPGFPLPQPAEPAYSVFVWEDDLGFLGSQLPAELQIVVPLRGDEISSIVMADIERHFVSPEGTPQAVVAEPIRELDEFRMVYSKTLQAFRLFAAFCLAASVIGTSGAVATDVLARQAEIGVRRALGAPAYDIIGSIIRTGGKYSGLGAVTGYGVSLAALTLSGSRLPLLESLELFLAVTLFAAGSITVVAFFVAGRLAKQDPASLLNSE